MEKLSKLHYFKRFCAVVRERERERERERDRQTDRQTEIGERQRQRERLVLFKKEKKTKKMTK